MSANTARFSVSILLSKFEKRSRRDAVETLLAISESVGFIRQGQFGNADKYTVTNSVSDQIPRLHHTAKEESYLLRTRNGPQAAVLSRRRSSRGDLPVHRRQA